MAQYPGCTVRTCACADLSVSVGDPDPHSAPSPLHVAEQPPLAPLSVSPAVFSPTSSLENHRIFSSEHGPSNPDGSDLGSVSWQERDFQPFTLEETESPRGLGELPGLETKISVYKVLETLGQCFSTENFVPQRTLAKSGVNFGFHNLQGKRGGSSGIEWIAASDTAQQPPRQFSGPKTPIVQRLGNPSLGHTVSDPQTMLFPQGPRCPICELMNKSKLF